MASLLLISYGVVLLYAFTQITREGRFAVEPNKAILYTEIVGGALITLFGLKLGSEAMLGQRKWNNSRKK